MVDGLGLDQTWETERIWSWVGVEPAGSFHFASQLWFVCQYKLHLWAHYALGVLYT